MRPRTNCSQRLTACQPSAGLLLAVLTLPAAEPQNTDGQPTEGPFKPDWQSLEAHQNPEWFRDAKFGIYTHWGPVTVGCEDALQGGEWYGREMYLTNNPIFAWHQQKFGDQHAFGYKDVIPRFTAPRFDPEKWADLFSRAGAKFAGPVAVHHDNFAMWDSAVTPWNSMKMGPKRDITGELARAYRARGLKLITTFHHGFAWRYYEPAMTVAGQSRSADVPKSDGWFRPLFVSFGELQFDKAGVFHLVLEPAAPDHWRAVNVYQIQMAKIE